jgi:hypothetical protein
MRYNRFRAGEFDRPELRRQLIPLQARPGRLLRRGQQNPISDRKAGTRFAERPRTVVATCRQEGRRLLDFLVATSEAALCGSQSPSLLPAPRVG